MKIKKSRLLQIIQEEISRLNEEDRYSDLSLDALAMAAKKDADAIGPLVDRLQKKNRKLAIRIAGGNEADAEEALQDMAIAVIQKLDSFKGEAAFSTWAGAIVKNAIIDSIRRGKKEKTFAGSSGRPGEASIGDISDASQGETVYVRPPVAHIPNPDQALMRKEREGAFGDLMAAVETGEIGLSASEKAVILNQLDDDPMSAAKLAAELGFERATSIGSLSSRARQKISAWLDSTNADAKTRKKIKELLSGVVSGGESLEETIKAAIMEMIDEGAIEGLDQVKKKDQDDLENEKAIRKGEIPKPGYKFPKSHDDGPVGNRIKGLEEGSVENPHPRGDSPDFQGYIIDYLEQDLGMPIKRMPDGIDHGYTLALIQKDGTFNAGREGQKPVKAGYYFCDDDCEVINLDARFDSPEEAYREAGEREDGAHYAQGPGGFEERDDPYYNDPYEYSNFNEARKGPKKESLEETIAEAIKSLLKNQ